LAVRVRIRREGDRLIIEVTNSTPQLMTPLPRSAFGDGLRNVEARLRAAFGEDASVRVGPGELSGTRAMLDMPANAAQAEPA
jgi:LytS/YehU family sensor histidine kinase